VSRAGLHRWHLRHVLHLDHLKNLGAVAAATVTTAAVVAAGVTVAATSRPPSGPGSAAQPAVAAYAAPLASIPATLTSSFRPVNGDTYVAYGPGNNNIQVSGVTLSGKITGATTGEVARLYAQPFPYTSPPVLAGSDILNSIPGTPSYSFAVHPTIATRYQVELLKSSTATTPLATSTIRTVYVTDETTSSFLNTVAFCAGKPTCYWTVKFTVYVSPSAIQAEMSKQKYLYIGINTHISDTPKWKLIVGTVSKPQLIADDAYEMTVSYTSGSNGPYADYLFCTKPTEAQDGFGLPGPSACGSAIMPSSSAAYAFGSSVPTAPTHNAGG
jgi:hypothetical protein